MHQATEGHDKERNCEDNPLDGTIISVTGSQTSCSALMDYGSCRDTHSSTTSTQSTCTSYGQYGCTSTTSTHSTGISTVTIDNTRDRVVATATKK